MHDAFHISQLKPVISFVPGLSGDTPSPFWPPVDNSGEFEIGDILDSCFVHGSCLFVEKFLINWGGCDLFKVIWEPLANLTICPDMLSSFC